MSSVFSVWGIPETWSDGGMESWKWRPGNTEAWRHGNVETWKHGDIRHGDMETWRHRDMETWRHGDVESWRHKTEAQAIFLNLFTVCSSCKRSSETNRSYPFANGIKRLAQLWIYLQNMHPNSYQSQHTNIGPQQIVDRIRYPVPLHELGDGTWNSCHRESFHFVDHVRRLWPE